MNRPPGGNFIGQRGSFWFGEMGSFWCGFSNPFNIGETEKDYINGKWIKVNQEQADFFKIHPYSSFSEIMKCELNAIPTPTIPIEEQYANRVEEIMREKGYTHGKEIRILFNGSSDPNYAIHEQDVQEAKLQAKEELEIE